MKKTGAKLLSLLITAAMVVGMLPTAAFAASPAYVRTFSGENSAVTISSSGDYKIAADAAFTGTGGSSAKAAMTIEDNLEVTLWFEGEATFIGADATAPSEVATPGIAMGKGSTLVFQKADTAAVNPDIYVRGGNGYNPPADSYATYIAGGGGAAGIGTCGGLGGQTYGEDGHDAPPMLANKIVVRQGELTLRAHGGKGGESGRGVEGSTGAGYLGTMFTCTVDSGKGGHGGGGAGDDGAAIGTGGGGGGAGGKGGSGTHQSGAGYQIASGGGGGGGGQSSNFVTTRDGQEFYLHGGGGGGGAGAYFSPSSVESNWSGGDFGKGGWQTPAIQPQDGRPGEYYRGNGVYCGGGYGGKAGGAGGAAGECTYDHGVDYPEGKGSPGGDGGAAGKAAEDFTAMTYIPEVTVYGPDDYIYDGDPIDPGKIRIVTSSNSQEKAISFRPQGTEQAFTATPPTDPGKYDVRVEIAGTDKYEPAVGYGTIEIQKRWLTLHDLTVKLTPNDFLYDPDVERVPELTVQDKGVDMTPGVDYEVSGTLRATKCGDYSVTVTGKGFYGGKVTLDWKIHEPIMQGIRTYLDGVEFDGSIRSPRIEYDGKPHKMVVTVDEPADGRVRYYSSKAGDFVDDPPEFTEIGNCQMGYEITKEGWNRVSDSSEFVIDPRTVEIVWDQLSFPYDGQPHLPTATIGNKVDGDDVWLELSSYLAPQTAVGKYRVQVLTVRGNGFAPYRYELPPRDDCFAEFEITPPMPTLTQAPAANELTYNGGAQALVTAGASDEGEVLYSLTEDGDYTSAIPTGQAAGDYTVWYKVKGSGNFGETKPVSLPVTIDPLSISGAAVTLGDALTYNGEEQEQQVASVVINGLNATFDVSDNRQTNADTYTLTITGNGSFTGSVTEDYTIGTFAATVTPDANQTKTYGDADPVFSYTANLFGDDTLTGALGREEGEAAGAYGYTLGTLANANYTLTLADPAAEFTVEARTPVNLDIVLNQNTFVYDGTEKKPTVTVLVDGTAIPESEYQTVTYRSNVEVSEDAVAIVKDAPGGNYVLPAVMEVPFSIVKSASQLTAISANMEDVTYGDVFTVTFTPKLLQEQNLFVRTFTLTPEPKTASLYYDGEKVADDLTGVTEDDVVSFTVTTLEKKLPASAFDGQSHVLTIKWSGDENLKPSTATVSMKFHPAAATAAVAPDTEKVYDGTAAMTAPVPLVVRVHGTDTVTATAAGSLAAANVGAQPFTATAVTLSGTDAGYYSLDPQAVTGSVEVVAREVGLVWNDLILPYTGDPQKPTATASNVVDGETVTVRVTGEQTNVGTYTAAADGLEGNTAANYVLPADATVSFEIQKAASTLLVRPTANKLKENGKQQELVKPGSSETGTVVYALDELGPYSEELPTGKKNGSYQVWFKVVGDANHNDTEPEMLTVSIHRRPLPADVQPVTPPAGSQPPVPLTGDNGHFALWALLGNTSLLCAALALGKKKKHSSR